MKIGILKGFNKFSKNFQRTKNVCMSVSGKFQLLFRSSPSKIGVVTFMSQITGDNTPLKIFLMSENSFHSSVGNTFNASSASFFHESSMISLITSSSDVSSLISFVSF